MKVVFDIGGTNMRVARVDANSLGKEVKEKTPQDFVEGAKKLKKLILQVTNSEKPERIVGACAGTITEDGKIIHSPHLLGWEGKDLGDFLKENVCPNVLIKNDADMAGLGEATFGAGKGKKVIGYITVGTGVGGVKIVDGKIDENRYGFEPGWMIISATDLTALGETVSGAALREKYNKHPQELDRVVYDRLIRTLAVGIYNAMLFWSPETIILGGSLIEEEEGYHLDDIVKALKEIENPFESLPEIKKAELGDKSGLMGCLSLF